MGSKPGFSCHDISRATAMLVKTLCLWLHDADNFKLLFVTFSTFSRLLKCEESVTKISKFSHSTNHKPSGSFHPICTSQGHGFMWREKHTKNAFNSIRMVALIFDFEIKSFKLFNSRFESQAFACNDHL